jgi:hypothetical protein
MNQPKIQSYINLIKKLLACSSGEEWIVLRQNEALVTPELVPVMEQVASQLAQQGNRKEAKFLHNLAGQIYHLFLSQTVSPSGEEEQSHLYLELIQALLDCPEGSEGELLLANQELIGPGLVAMMQKVATQLANSGNSQEANYLQKWATEINQLWLKQHDFQPIPNPEPEQLNFPENNPPSSPPQVQPSSPLSVEQLHPAEMANLTADPWGEPLAEPPPADFTLPEESTISPPEPTQSLPVEEQVRSQRSPDITTPDVTIYEQINRHLETIAGALTKISETLTPSAQPPTDPLWYMDALERASAGKWILTSEEVKHLIGVQPTCAKESDSFQRGCWVFIKAGRLGSQTAWRVKKVDK